MVVEPNLLQITVSQPDYSSVQVQAVQVGLAIQMDPVEAEIVALTIPEIGGTQGTIVATCADSTEILSDSSIAFILSEVSSATGVEDSLIEQKTSFVTRA